MANNEEHIHEPSTSLQKLSRRSFLSRAGAVGVATAVATLPVPASAEQVKQETMVVTTASIPGTMPVTLKVNGESHSLRVDPRATLLNTLRESVGLTGTKKGCDHSQCGACTVHVSGRRAYSCLLLAAMQQHADITTIEGLGTPEKMHPMQASFIEHDGYQCGYCTSGQIMAATAMMREPCGSADSDVKEALSGNICRCGSYPNIVAAVQAVRRLA